MKTTAAFFILNALLSSTAFADLLVSNDLNGVDRYTNNGVFLGKWIAPGAGGLHNARGVAVSPTGELFVGNRNADDTSNILRFSANGTFLGVFSSDEAVDIPFDLVFGTGGDLFVASAGPTSNVARLDPTTGAVINPDFNAGSVPPVGGPQYMEFGTALALTDIAGRLFRFDPTTGAATFPTFFLDNPEGVAYAANGDLYVAQRISDNIVRIPAGSNDVIEVVPNGAFAGDADLEFGPDGLLYVAADTIYRYDVSGAKGVLVDSFGDGGEFLVFAPDVPEPGTWALAAAGLACVWVLRRRRPNATGSID